MKHQMIKSMLAAALLTPIGLVVRADDAVVEVAPDNQPARVRVEARATAGPHERVLELVPGGAGETLRIVGNGQPMRTMTFVNAGGKMEKGTVLGVTTSTVPAALRAQMSLQKGFGLIVETIEKESPAEKAGIEKYDILQKFNDQMLINQQQLQVLVRSMKAGDSVAITLLRKGQPMTVNTALVEKDVPAVVEANIVNGVFTEAIAPEMMRWEANTDVQNVLGKLNLNTSAATNIVSTDNDQTLELSNKDGNKRLIVKDNEDKVLFDGPIDTQEQREKLPEVVAAKLEKLESKLQKITVRAKVNAIHASEEEK